MTEAWGRVRRLMWMALGFVLIAVGLVGMWIPFTFHALAALVVVGAMLVLRNSLAWRRRFIRLHRRHPRHLHRLRRLLRRKPEVAPVLWHELLRLERLAPRRWRRLVHWRRSLMARHRRRSRERAYARALPRPEPTRFDADYFEGLYQADADPWSFEGSRYENRKYEATVAALGGRRYGRVLEVGCSIGILTRLLSPLSRDLVALDISATAIETARTRNADLTNASYLASGFLEADLAGPFDLIVFSEVLYYLTPEELVAAAHRTLDLLAPGGELMLVNWLGQGHHPLSGDQAAEGFMAALGPGFTRIAGKRQRKYRLDYLRRA